MVCTTYLRHINTYRRTMLLQRLRPLLLPLGEEDTASSLAVSMEMPVAVAGLQLLVSLVRPCLVRIPL